MADAGNSRETSVEQSGVSENMEFNAEGLTGVFSAVDNEGMEVDNNADGTNSKLTEEAKWEDSVGGHQVEAPIQDAMNNQTNFEQPMESDSLQQLQAGDGAVHDPADIALLNFGIEPTEPGHETTHDEFLQASLQQSGMVGLTGTAVDAAMHGDLHLEKECIKIKVVSQRLEKMITVYPSYNVLQLKSIVEAKFQVDINQICLIKDQKILGDAEILTDLGIENDSEVLLVVRYFPQNMQPSDDQNHVHFWPAQYTRLGLPNFDLAEYQEQVQKQFNENPELVREAMMNPRVQELIADPARVKEMILSVPSGQKLLEKRPDIAEALSNPKIMEESLRVAQDQGLLEETLSKMPAARDPNRMPTFTVIPPQEIPSSETMMKMTCQDPEMLVKMFSSPHYKAMIEGMVANPTWAEKMMTNNPLLAANPQMRNQIKSFLPMFLNQLQNPEYVAMLSNSKALKSMLKVQQGICNLQSEAPNLSLSMGFSNFSAPGTFNIQVEGETDQDEMFRPYRGEADPMSIMMAQVARQTKDGTIDLPPCDRYSKQLDLMEKMGFQDRETNLAFLTATFGDVDAAVSQLLL